MEILTRITSEGLFIEYPYLFTRMMYKIIRKKRNKKSGDNVVEKEMKL